MNRLQKQLRSLLKVLRVHRKSILTSVVGSFVALVFAPVSIWLGFSLNNYLSSPLLSVEYVQVVKISEKIKFDRSQIRQLIRSPTMEAFLDERSNEENTIRELEYKDTLDVAHVERYRAAITSLLLYLKNRRRNVSLYSDSNIDLSVRAQLSAEILNGTFDARLASGAAESDRIVRDRVKKESALLDKDINFVEELSRLLYANSSVRIFLQINVMNRGLSDGLIRGAGFLKSKSFGALQIVHVQAPRQNDEVVAVPVAVVAPLSILASGPNSVGRVPAKAMVEFWFELKIVDGEKPDATKITGGEVVLFDHEKNEIHGKIEKK